jgi:nucleoid-associated protein YgaU
MRYFLIAFLIICCFSFGLLAQEEEAVEEEVMEEGVAEEEAAGLVLSQQKWTPAQADSIINALTTEEDALRAKLAELEEQIDVLQIEVSDMDAEIEELEAMKAELEEKLEQISWYKVKVGDYLCKIAEDSEIYGYGKYARWKEIYNANKDKISDPNLIQPGWNIFIPRP